MSDTPRTDAVAAQIEATHSIDHWDVASHFEEGYYKFKELAQELERELVRPEVAVTSVRESTQAVVINGRITVPAMLFRDGEVVEVMVTPSKPQREGS